MYAIIQTGGKQYKVQPGDQLKVEKLPGEPGTEIHLDHVLALGSPEGITLGKPTVEGARVEATIVKTARDRKVVVFKKKRRKGYHKKQGHRQWYTLLKVNTVVTSKPGLEMDQPAETPQTQIPEA
jgi:large subunit ribosomal protein L21